MYVIIGCSAFSSLLYVINGFIFFIRLVEGSSRVKIKERMILGSFYVFRV